MSEIVNYSVKIDAEQRDLLQKKIAESEMTAGNFLSAMLANYEAAQSREFLSDIRELNQVRNHLARIEEIYIGLAKSRKDGEEGHEHSVNDLNEQLVVLKAQMMDTQATAKADIQTITKQMQEITEKAAQESKKYLSELSELTAQKNKAEDGQLQALKIANLTEQALVQVQAEITVLKTSTALHQQKAEQAINDLDQTTLDLHIAMQELSALKSQLEKERENFKRSLKDQEQRSELTKQQAVLSAQQAALEKRENLQDEIVTLRDQLAAERVHIAQTLLISNSTIEEKKVESV